MAVDIIQPVDLTIGEAKSITMKIALVMTSIQDQREKWQRLVIEAYTGRVWVALGYESWDRYAAAEFKAELSREESRQANIDLGREGMSTRAIAAVTGTSNKTVNTDMKAAGVTGSNTSLGPDGKTYHRPEVTAPRTRRRKPLPDAFRDAMWDLQRAVERLDRLTKDDRFAAHQDALWKAHFHQMNAITEALDDVDLYGLNGVRRPDAVEEEDA